MQDLNVEFKYLMKKSMLQVSILGRIVTSKHFINEATSSNERIDIFERLKKHLEFIKKEDYKDYSEIDYEIKGITYCIEKMTKVEIKDITFYELMKIYKYGEGDIKKVNDILDKTIKEKSLDIEDIEDNNIDYNMDTKETDEYNIDYDMDIEDIINGYIERSIISSMKI